jgi:hypothetical protein
VTATRLQELYAQALARRSTAGTAECVSPDDLLALVRREGTESRRLEVLDHVMGCNPCRRELDLLRALEAAGAESAGVSRPGLGRRLMPWALAASVLLAVGIGVAVRNNSQLSDTPRGGANGIVLLAPPIEVVSGEPITFVWRPVAGAHRYRVEILDDKDATLFAGQTTDTTLRWSGEQLRPGWTYRWWVRDATPGAQLVSPLRPLRVRRE